MDYKITKNTSRSSRKSGQNYFRRNPDDYIEK